MTDEKRSKPVSDEPQADLPEQLSADLADLFGKSAEVPDRVDQAVAEAARSRFESIRSDAAGGAGDSAENAPALAGRITGETPQSGSTLSRMRWWLGPAVGVAIAATLTFAFVFMLPEADEAFNDAAYESASQSSEAEGETSFKQDGKVAQDASPQATAPRAKRFTQRDVEADSLRDSRKPNARSSPSFAEQSPTQSSTSPPAEQPTWTGNDRLARRGIAGDGQDSAARPSQKLRQRGADLPAAPSAAPQDDMPQPVAQNEPALALREMRDSNVEMGGGGGMAEVAEVEAAPEPEDGYALMKSGVATADSDSVTGGKIQSGERTQRAAPAETLAEAKSVGRSDGEFGDRYMKDAEVSADQAPQAGAFRSNGLAASSTGPVVAEARSREADEAVHESQLKEQTSAKRADETPDAEPAPEENEEVGFDPDGSGKTDVADVVRLAGAISSFKQQDGQNEAPGQLDLTGDGQLDEEDVQAAARLVVRNMQEADKKDEQAAAAGLLPRARPAWVSVAVPVPARKKLVAAQLTIDPSTNGRVSEVVTLASSSLNRMAIAEDLPAEGKVNVVLYSSLPRMKASFAAAEAPDEAVAAGDLEADVALPANLVFIQIQGDGFITNPQSLVQGEVLCVFADQSASKLAATVERRQIEVFEPDAGADASVEERPSP